MTNPAPKPANAFLTLNTDAFTLSKPPRTLFKACCDLSFATISILTLFVAINDSSFVVVWLYHVVFQNKPTTY